MRSSSALNKFFEQECGPLGGIRKAGVAAHGAPTPALPKFLEQEIAQRPAQALAFNGPEVSGSKILAAKRDRDFQVVEAFVAVTYTLPADGIKRTRRVLASLRLGDDQPKAGIRKRLISQAEEFFVLMAKAGREAMFSPVIVN